MARILAFADPHGEIQWAEALLDLVRREDPDLLACAGDLTWFGSRHETFLRRLGEAGRDVYFVPGNHEGDLPGEALTAEFPFLKEVTHQVVEAAGVRIGGLPAGPAYGPGGRAEPAEVKKACSLWGRSGGGTPLVLLSHYPPFRTEISGVSRISPDSGGSVLVRAIVEEVRPALVVCGHYHQDAGKEALLGGVRLVNPGPGGRIVEA